MCLNSVGLSGGIGFWWKDLNIRVCSYSAHHFEVDFHDNNDVPLWRAIGVYGWPEATNKHLMWQLM